MKKAAIFSSLNSDIKSIIFTSIYFIILFIFFIYSMSIAFDPYGLQTSHFSNLIEAGIIIIIISLIFSLTIHKSFLFGYISLLSGIFIFILFNYIGGDSERARYIFLFLVGTAVYSLPILGIVILARFYFRIKSLPIRIILASIPFIFLLVILLFGLANSRAPELADCKGLSDEFEKLDCIKKLNIEDFTICEEFRASNIQSDCYLYIIQKLYAQGKFDETTCQNYINTGSYYHCILGLAYVKKDASYCQSISDGYYKNSCNYYAKGRQ